MGFGNFIGGALGGALGGYVGGTAGSVIGGAAGSTIAGGGKINFGDALLGGLAGFGAHELALGLDIYGGAVEESAGLGSDIASGFGPDAGSTVAPLESATGVGTSAKGLLDRALNSKWLKSDAAGRVFLGVGQQLIAGDPAVESGKAVGAQTRAKQDEIAQNYRAVEPPSDSSGRFVRDPKTGNLVFMGA